MELEREENYYSVKRDDFCGEFLFEMKCGIFLVLVILLIGVICEKVKYGILYLYLVMFEFYYCVVFDEIKIEIKEEVIVCREVMKNYCKNF